MDRQIWQWTLTKEAVAPCFVRDVFSMRQNNNGDVDFFWLGHTPCRTVLLVGMVVGVKVYDKRSIYTIDDGTAVIDCVLRHPHMAIPEPKPRSPPRSSAGPDTKPSAQRPSPKKPRFDKVKLETTETPFPTTEPGCPVRVVGRVARHYESKQIYADTIDPCPSSLDEIAHLERVIQLHKTKYSLAIPFVPPPKLPRAPQLDMSTRPAGAESGGSVFSDTSHPPPRAVSYSLPPPPMPIAVQNRNRLPSMPTHLHSVHHDRTRVPSSPTSIASSTPSSPCKPSTPAKTHEARCKPKLRHPSRLHTRDLTGNIFRLYVKHYMDNAPSHFPVPLPSPLQSEVLITPTKHARDEVCDEPTPRPRHSTGNNENEDRPALGFTISHLRRVPELALLAARVVRSEARRRDKAEREKEHGYSPSRVSPSRSALARSDGRRERNWVADSPRKKIKRLFAWAVVKLYEEGSIVLWDGDVRPLPVPPPPVAEGGPDRDESGLWKGNDTRSTCCDPLASVSTFSSSASVLYASSASASLYSHYHPPRRATKRKMGDEAEGDVLVEDHADPGNVSDPGLDEEAYVPLTPQLLVSHIRKAVGVLHRGQGRGRGGTSTGPVGHGRGSEPTPEGILKYLQRSDGRWARVGLWAVEEALAMLRPG